MQHISCKKVSYDVALVVVVGSDRVVGTFFVIIVGIILMCPIRPDVVTFWLYSCVL